MILGLDTSCYTTSLALIDDNGKLLTDKRRVLDVPLGKRGLSQSEALFQHIQNIPALIEEAGTMVDFKKLRAIGVSSRPRPITDSYMPVFLGGVEIARTLGAALNIPVYDFSHQEGHMMAGMQFSNFPYGETKPFLMCHFSGGTSEIHAVEKSSQGKYKSRLIAATGDLHGGQLVDRIGVALKLPFPAGKTLEQWGAKATGSIPKIPSTFQKDIGMFSFSGQETALQKLIVAGENPNTIARAVEDVLYRTLKKALLYAVEITGIHDVLLVGGVMSNQWIAQRTKEGLPSLTLYFASSAYATDNAVGIAYLTLERINDGRT